MKSPFPEAVDHALAPVTHYSPDDAWHFGPERLTEAAIIEYATLLDPQRIHIDKAYAEQSRFGGLIASGIHPYLHFHKKYWIPFVANTFIAGLSVDKVEFFAPVYPEQPIWGKLEVAYIHPKPEKQAQVIQWLWSFYDQNGQLLQQARYTSFHKLIAEH